MFRYNKVYITKSFPSLTYIIRKLLSFSCSECTINISKISKNEVLDYIDHCKIYVLKDSTDIIKELNIKGEIVEKLKISWDSAILVAQDDQYYLIVFM